MIVRFALAITLGAYAVIEGISAVTTDQSRGLLLLRMGIAVAFLALAVGVLAPSRRRIALLAVIGLFGGAAVATLSSSAVSQAGVACGCLPAAELSNHGAMALRGLPIALAAAALFVESRRGLGDRAKSLTGPC